MRVISNTSPVCNLAVIGRLDILRQQFGEILIPDAVGVELERLEHSAGCEAIHRAYADGWIKIRPHGNKDLYHLMTSSLDAGESEAIALAASTEADLLVMDESAGRLMARGLGLTMTGTLGLLLKEKNSGRIPSLAVEMDRLVHDAGFFLSKSLRHQLLIAAGEG